VLAGASTSRREFTLCLAVSLEKLRDLIGVNHIILSLLGLVSRSLSGSLASLLLIGNKINDTGTMDAATIKTRDNTKRGVILVIKKGNK
jgi:hypothetical protein